MKKAAVVIGCLIMLLAAFFGGRFSVSTLGEIEAPKNVTTSTSATPTKMWEKFGTDLQVAGVSMIRELPVDYPIDQAEGVRFMLRQLRSSIDMVLAREQGMPSVFRLGTNTSAKWGLDGADGKYTNAAITGQV